jgi:hypothetical protein
MARHFRYMTSLSEKLSPKEVGHRLVRSLRDRVLQRGVRTARGVEFPLAETN